MSASRKVGVAVLAVILLFTATLACGPTATGTGPSVTISSPLSGTTVVVGQAVEIASLATADAGVARVELSVNGQVVRTDAPPSGNPTSFSVVQIWTPAVEGQVVIAVVAYDAEDAASDPATIRLMVAATAGEASPEPGVTDTPEPDVTTEAGCTLNATYVADVTIPDDTELAPGTAFVKTWRIRNSGTCDWTAGFQFVFVSGDQMGGEALVAVPPTAAGSTADLSVNLTAPSTPGTYRGNWRTQSDEGLAFGNTVYVRIVVPAPATDTPEPTEEPTPESTEEPTPFGGGIGRIAYVSFRDGNAEIYVMGEDDSAPTRLTNNPEIDDWPDWSPDGTKIAFTRYFGGKPDIYVMKADGSFQVNVASHPAWDTAPAWSPDGTRIAFTSGRGGGKLQIWVMKADGSDLIQLTDTPQLNSSPTWSPDGNRIAFESDRDGQREIYVMNSDGTSQTRVTTTGNNYGPEWAPTGERVAFSSSNGIWTVRVDGSGLKQLTTNAGPLIFDVHPYWSPDRTKIVFDSKRGGGNSDLWMVNPDGSGLTQLTTNAAPDANPAWR